jgi:hypothetical protein
MSKIHVSGSSATTTEIVVRDWPDKQASWCVATSTRKGRVLHVVGWHRWAEGQVVGRLELHVHDQRSLLITRYSLVEDLIENERVEVLGALVVCAQEIALVLHNDLSLGDGCLEWQLDHSKVDAIQHLFPGFCSAPKRNPTRPGQRHLRKCP